MTLQEMIQEAQKLSNEECRQLMQALTSMEGAPKKKYRLSDLRGVGAEIWEGIDPQEYINQLRSEWDHRP